MKTIINTLSELSLQGLRALLAPFTSLYHNLTTDMQQPCCMCICCPCCC